MADPKTDTIRIALPARAEPDAANPSAAGHDAARIVLPSRPPVTPIRRLPSKITPSPISSSLLQPLAKPPGMTTLQPGTPVDAIPRSLAWGLLALSAAIFLIQIWNYVVS